MATDRARKRPDLTPEQEARVEERKVKLRRMAIDLQRKRPDLTPEQEARVEAIRARTGLRRRALRNPEAVRRLTASTARREPSKRRAMVPPWGNWWNSVGSS